MKLTPEDPQLSAYVLGELSSDDARQIERAAAADPSLRMSLDDLQGLTGFLSETLGGNPASALRPMQREAVLRASREADSHGKVVALDSGKRSWRPWLTGLGAAATVAIAAILVSRLDDGATKAVATGSQVPKAVSLLPMPGPDAVDAGGVGVAAGGEAQAIQAEALRSRADSFLGDVVRQLETAPLPEAPDLPGTGDLAGFSPEESQRLPVLIGTSSATWVRRWIEEKDELPPHHAVRVEELINTTQLPTSMSVGGLNIGIQTIEWRGTRWLGVQLSAGDDTVEALELRSLSKAERRLVGSFGFRGDAAMPSVLPAKRSTLLLLEFKDPEASLGTLELLINGQREMVELGSLVELGAGEMKHAVAMAAFGLWLRDELDESRLLVALELAEQGAVDPVAVSTHRLIRRAISLSQAGH